MRNRLTFLFCLSFAVLLTLRPQLNMFTWQKKGYRSFFTNSASRNMRTYYWINKRQPALGWCIQFALQKECLPTYSDFVRHQSFVAAGAAAKRRFTS